MAHNRSFFLQALDRSESRRDGGYKHGWSFSLSGDGEEERKHETNVVNVEEMDRQQPTSPEEKKSPSFRHFGPSDSLRTYENRSNNRMRPLSKLAPKRLSEVPLTVPTSSHIHNKTNFLILSPSSPQGIVLQGRHFQHAVPTTIRKPAQSSLDLKERNDFSTTQQAVEVDSIILTCPEIQEEETLNIKRRVLQKRKPLEDVCGFPSQVKAAELLVRSSCSKCSKPPTGSPQQAPPPPTGAVCLSCDASDLSPPAPPPAGPPPPGHALAAPPAPPLPLRAPPTTIGPTGLQQQGFYRTAAPPTRTPLPPPTRTPLPPPTGTSSCCGPEAPAKGRRGAAHKLNDPIVLSSDDEEEEEEPVSEGVGRLDSVSPRPADSAHSSPAPSGGRVEAAVKGAGEQEEPATEFFEDICTKISIPRRARMKDQFGNQPVDPVSPRCKKPKMAFSRCDSIILECRSVRVGTLRRILTRPVVFSVDQIVLETEAPAGVGLERLALRCSELTSCEWCSVRKLPVLFLQTSARECLRLQEDLRMAPGAEPWYDCAADQPDQRYIVLILENGLHMREQLLLEDIMAAVGSSNRLPGFPSRLSFQEANSRLVSYNRAQQEPHRTHYHRTPPHPYRATPPPTADWSATTAPSSRTRPPPTPPARRPPPAPPARTRMSTRQQPDAEDDLQPTFSGPVVKLMVYPPPPAKGGISVTNEDLHCLNAGEFLNDVIIDFYLKYLVLEKLRKEDAQRIHVFSSFFYKRLNQRERRSGPEAANLPIQKRKHNRVKTWTRHVDLFQKDFIFVPINESAHWYLAVICFPGLEGPVFEKNPHFPGPAAPGVAVATAPEDGIPDHCRPLSPDRDALDGSGPPSPAEPEQTGGEERYTSELHRISVCYGSSKDDAFSDDQSSCQDECSEDGALAEDGGGPDGSSLAPRATICKQPCILVMDSLRGPARSTVVKTLREYLEVEWEVRKGSQRSFGKDVMRGSSPRVPQQDNFSDCGVYVLQYVESFFENPIPSFHLPVSLSEWFPPQRMRTKREEIRGLILRLQEEQQEERRRGGGGPPQPPGGGGARGDPGKTSSRPVHQSLNAPPTPPQAAGSAFGPPPPQKKKKHQTTPLNLY
ncbi:LOW QUALITY PROTEIN: sentrin-specific protease 6 [Menidia menidia]